jgi:hypothetical protein
MRLEGEIEMWIHKDVDTQWRDAFGEIHIPKSSECPEIIRPYCEKILTMYTKLGSSCPTNYTDMTTLDKLIMLDYWREYDGLDNVKTMKEWEQWFVHKAEAPEWIRRSREYLKSRHAIKVKDFVTENAQKAGQNFRNAVKRK